jgi:hypothetical protein
MIRVNELRIGNILGEVGSERMFRVRSVSQSGVLVNYGTDGETVWLDENKLIPIPLRSELLEKSGFKPAKTESSHTLELSGGIIEVINCKDVFLRGFGSTSEGLSFYCTVAGIHQFQNLIFSITGIEPVLSF